jgi:hypothetical protein
MRHLASWITFCGVLISGFTSAADDDPVEKNLTAAKEDFEKTAERARAGLLADLQKRTDAAQKAGDLKTLEKVQSEAKAFQDGGELPKSVSTKAYESQMRRARARLEDEYVAAIKRYTKDGKIALAKAVQQELDEFKAGSSRPADAVKSGDKYFKVFDRSLTWHEAKKQCEEMGGQLAIVDSAEENELVTRLATTSKVSAVWLGGADEKKEGTWVWVDGQTVKYDNWDRTSSQPNNALGVEHYIVLRVDKGGRWWDYPDDTKKYPSLIQPGNLGFVCQWK